MTPVTEIPELLGLFRGGGLSDFRGSGFRWVLRFASGLAAIRTGRSWCRRQRELPSPGFHSLLHLHQLKAGSAACQCVEPFEGCGELEVSRVEQMVVHAA